MENEIWMPVKGYEGLYEVSHLGNVKSLYKCRGTCERIIKPNDIGGRVNVSLHKNGKQKTYYIHTLVISAFNCNNPGSFECCHNDGNYKNNYIGNLRWGTSKENSEDQKAHGTIANGEKHGSSRLTNDDIVNIRKLLKTNLLHKEIAVKYNVCRQNITSINTKRLWKHI